MDNRIIQLYNEDGSRNSVIQIHEDMSATVAKFGHNQIVPETIYHVDSIVKAIEDRYKAQLTN